MTVVHSAAPEASEGKWEYSNNQDTCACMLSEVCLKQSQQKQMKAHKGIRTLSDAV